MKKNHQHDRVLAIYPSTTSFAFVLFEAPFTPYDWGFKDIRGKDKNAETRRGVQSLIEKYHPDCLVIEDHTEKGCRRAERIQKLYRSLIALGGREKVAVSRIQPSAVRKHFAMMGVKTKYDTAQEIAAFINAFAHRLPKKRRKAWMSLDPRQSLFDAAALGLTHYQCSERHGLNDHAHSDHAA